MVRGVGAGVVAVEVVDYSLIELQEVDRMLWKWVLGIEEEEQVGRNVPVNGRRLLVAVGEDRWGRVGNGSC